MFHILGIIIAVYVGIVLLSWVQAARPDHPAAQGRRIGVVTWADLVAMLVRRIWRISVFCAAWVLRPRPKETREERRQRRRQEQGLAEAFARENWERQHAALLEERPELRAELARQAAERESEKRAAERRRQAIARTGAGFRRTWAKLMKAAT